MRGCLGVLLLAAIVLVGAAWFGGPTLAGVIVEGALDVAGLESRNRSVRVESDPPIEILGGHADRVIIRADDVVLADLDADRLDLTLIDVDLVTRTFGSIEGRLAAVVLTAGDGSATQAETVDLLGPADAVVATGRISGPVVDRLARAALASQEGLTVDSVTLEAPDRIAFQVGPARVTGRLAVDAAGTLTATLEAPGDRVVTLLSPDSPFTLTGVSVEDADLVLTGTIDLDSLLR